MRRILLLLTYRSDQASVGSALGQLRDSLDRQRLARELRLAPLELTDVDGMLRAILSLDRSPRRDFLDLVSALTEGNPLLSRSLCLY